VRCCCCCHCSCFPITGLYKQLSTLRDLLNDVRGDPKSVTSLKLPIASNVDACGLQVGGCCSDGVILLLMLQLLLLLLLLLMLPLLQSHWLAAVSHCASWNHGA